jgi:hypothetical protein
LGRFKFAHPEALCQRDLDLIFPRTSFRFTARAAHDEFAGGHQQSLTPPTVISSPAFEPIKESVDFGECASDNSAEPMPGTSVSTTTVVKPGFFNSWRKANLKSFMVR